MQQSKPDVGQTLRSYRNLDVEVEHMRKLEEAFTLEDGPFPSPSTAAISSLSLWTIRR